MICTAMQQTLALQLIRIPAANNPVKPYFFGSQVRVHMNEISKMPLHGQNPSFGTGPISVAPYLSQSQFDDEIAEIFRKDWLWVARDEELPDPGDYKVKRLDFANTSVIIIRGKDGKVRAFHNVCRHRGNKVVIETGEESFGSSKAAVVTCRFHGWVYGADGSLVDVPEQEKFPACFDKAENGLIPIAVDVWQGFIHINLDPSPATTLMEFLGGVDPHLAGFPFDQMTHSHSYSAVLKCSWKVGMDAFVEGYHVPTIHSGSFPGLTDYWLDDVAFYGDHKSQGFYADGVNPGTPVGNAANALFAGSIALERSEPFELPKSVNPNASMNFGFDQTIIFPNTIFHVGVGLWFTHQFWPVTQDTCLWQGKYFLRAPVTNSEYWAQRYAVVLQRNAWLEDTATMEDTQTALKSGALDKMNLQDGEIMIRHSYDVIENRINGARAKEEA